MTHPDVDNWPDLRGLIASELDGEVAPEIARLSNHIRAGRTGVVAVLFYGAGLWQAPSADAVLDFYLLTESYRSYDPRRLHAVLGHLLPPNVYFLIHGDMRCKLAVIRIDQFERGAAGRGPTTQIWARFAQPCRLVYARDDAVRERVESALASAVVTFHANTLPLLPAHERRASQLWTTGLARTYGNEWRSEGHDRAAAIYDASQAALDARSDLVLPGCRPVRHPATRGLRRVLAKTVYFVQLTKAVFTFEGGVDYALWKIERQSGVRLRASEFQRRHPLIAAWPLVWQAWRRGGLR